MTRKLTATGTRAYLLIAGLALLAILGIFAKSAVGIKAARASFRHEQHQISLDVKKDFDAQINQIYDSLRTISYLPSIRKISRHGKTLDVDSKQSVQAIYTNLASNVSVSEVYVVPANINPDIVDPITGDPEAPILMFDSLITGDMTEAKADPSDGSALEEVEIYEYHLLQEQMAWFKAHVGNLGKIDGLNTPMISGPSVITCDNTEYAKTLNDADRWGLVFSVPFYGPDGQFKGVIAAIIRDNAIRGLLPARNFALANTRYGVFLPSTGGFASNVAAEKARQGVADATAAYSELLLLKDADPRSEWRISANAPEADFYATPAYREIKAFQFAAIIAVLAGAALASGAQGLLARAAAARLEAEGARQRAGEELEQVMEALAKAMSELAQGDLAIRLNERFPGSYERLRSDFNATVGQMQSANAQARAAADAEEVEHAELVNGLGRALSAIASGDLTTRIDNDFPRKYAQLRRDFNAAIDALDSLISSIHTTTEGVDGGATQIAHAADELSRRTEQQAASLEQTAAALDQLTTTVRQTATGTQQAHELVLEARNRARKSGEVVKLTVQAMGAIEVSSREISQISQISGVIDEIAYQTNLLALNAGVEAARAGDAGRGFAVVAYEVRALAQRSAEAAKAIKRLIEVSERQVSSGVAQVSETGQALHSIVEQVARIDKLVTGMASATQEQATGLDEINSAVSQMDQMTQESTGMVKKTTAAAHAMRGRARDLAGQIDGFRLSGSDRTHGAARRVERAA